jgi:tRNA/rRNA methyltransferase
MSRLARAILTVPINPEFASLNLAQAVILVPMNGPRAIALAQPTEEELLPPAPQEELEGMIAQFDHDAGANLIFHAGPRSDVTRRTLRNLLTKPGWNHLEVRTLRGVLFSSLANPAPAR